MNILSFIVLSWKRLRSRAGLSLLYVLSFAFTVGITVGVPLFTDGVGRHLVQEELAVRTKVQNRPPFSVRFYSQPNSSTPLSIEDAALAQKWMAGLLAQQVGLPVSKVYAQFEGPSLQLRPKPEDTRFNGETLDTVQVNVVADLEQHVRVVEGAALGSVPAPEELGVWLDPQYAEKLTFQVGEAYDAAFFFMHGTEPLTVRIMGLIEPLDRQDPYWYSNPTMLFKGVLLTSLEQYQRHIAPISAEGTSFDFWYFILDDARMNLDNAPKYVAGLEIAEREIVKRLPAAKMDYSPSEELVRGQGRKDSLSTVLVGFSIPLVGILILFMAAVSAMAARFQTQETATLLSRGTSRWQVMGLVAQETLVLFLVSLGPGILLGWGLARVLGYALGFLQFVPRAPLAIHLASVNWRYIVVGASFGVMARLLPAWLATRLTIVTYEQRNARRRLVLSSTRILLLLLLVGVTAYAYRQLSHAGTLLIGSWLPGQKKAPDLLNLLAPSFFIFSAPLLASELFPYLMRVLAFVTRSFVSATMYMSMMHLGREGNQFRLPAFLLVLTLTVGVFYAALAKSADIWMVERRQYEAGADMSFFPDVVSSDPTAGGVPSGDTSASNAAFLVPPEEYQEIRGVAQAMRITEFRARISSIRNSPQMRLLGIDRTIFPQIAFYRDDFASTPLSELLAALTRKPDGILISEELAKTLGPGGLDKVTVTFLYEEDWASMDFSVVGTYRYFPTAFEKQAPVLVANQDYLEQQIGGILPHRILMRLTQDADAQRITEELTTMTIATRQAYSVQKAVAQDQARLERVGIFGMLSVSYVAAALFAGVGLLVYSFASIMGRTYRLAVLQVLGMTKSELMVVVAFEYIVTLLYSVALGLGAGILAARLYVPFFAITETPELPIPPFLPHLDWVGTLQMGAAMAFSLLIVQAFILARVRRTRVFEALRMGTRE